MLKNINSENTTKIRRKLIKRKIEKLSKIFNYWYLNKKNTLS